MLTQNVTIVENVGGEEQEVETILPSTEFAVKVDGVKYQPTVTTSIEIENDGDIATTRDQCGHTERSRQTNKGWNITIQGIVTGNNARQGNMSLSLVRDVIATSETINVRSDIISGKFEVGNVVITQSADLVSIQTADTEGEEKAFEFQLQLGESSSE